MFKYIVEIVNFIHIQMEYKIFIYTNIYMASQNVFSIGLGWYNKYKLKEIAITF